MVAARLANISRGDFAGNQHTLSANLPTPQVTQTKAAEMLNVGERSLRSAKQAITEGSPELVQAGVSAVSCVLRKLNLLLAEALQQRFYQQRSFSEM